MITQNTNFVNNSKRHLIIPGFMYIYQLKEYSIHLAMLQKIQNTLNLTLAKQSKHVIVTDRKALIIKV